MKSFLESLLILFGSALRELFSAKFWIKSKMSYFDFIGIILIASAFPSLSWSMVGCFMLLGVCSSILRNSFGIRED